MIRLYRGAVFKDLSLTGGSCRGAARGRACRSPVSIIQRLAPSGCCHPPGAPLAPTGGQIQPHPLMLTGVHWVSWGAGKGEQSGLCLARPPWDGAQRLGAPSAPSAPLLGGGRGRTPLPIPFHSGATAAEEARTRRACRDNFLRRQERAESCSK